eukprot:381564-Pyramimonas_sp.AAC.1
MTSTGAQYLRGLLSWDYQQLWVAAPADWHVRLPGERAGPRCQRIQNLMVKARALRMSIVFMGPPSYFWRVCSSGTIEDFRLADHANAMLSLWSEV